ncbi:MAG TPA: hypothetical protein VM534_03740 [Thermoanaerobaculia bacterium]|nr:hypothetical protein [Thermoanaerobaculia bacterium]
MSATGEAMRITFDDQGTTIRERLRQRLEQVATLRCVEHGEPVVAVTIHARENGWFDSRWTTCCETLEQQALSIVKQRC